MVAHVADLAKVITSLHGLLKGIRLGHIFATVVFTTIKTTGMNTAEQPWLIIFRESHLLYRLARCVRRTLVPLALPLPLFPWLRTQPTAVFTRTITLDYFLLLYYSTVKVHWHNCVWLRLTALGQTANASQQNIRVIHMLGAKIYPLNRLAYDV